MSPAQRELKKLEDYWTRNSPVLENSPRLRSKRKVVFDVKQCLGHGRRSVKGNAGKEEEPMVEVNNGNSKIQDQVQVFSEKTNEKNEDNEELTNTVKAKDNAKTKFKNQEEMDLWKEVNYQRDTQDGKHIKPLRDCCIKSEVKESYSRNETRTRNAVPKKENSCFESESKTSEVSVDIPGTSTKEGVHDPVVAALDSGTDLGDSSDEDDEDYIPPRKKLRSEVTDDELWEGFPLTVSFKRLAPIKKKTKENDNLAQNETPVQSTGQAKDYKRNLKLDDHNIQNAETIDKKDANGITENMCHQKNVDKDEVKTSDESKSSEDYKEIESNNLPGKPKGGVHEEEKSDLESSTIMMSPEKLMKQSLSQILSFGTEEEPFSDAEANQTDLSIKAQMSVSLSTTLENIFHFSNSEVCQVDNSLFSDIKSLQHSNETTPLRRSRRILELEQIKCVKPMGKHEIINFNDSDIVIGGSDEITGSDNIGNELVHETDKLELDRSKETVTVPSSEESLFTNREQRISNIFTKSKPKARLIPPLRIKLKQPLKCTLKKTCDSKSQGHTKKSNDNCSAPKCKLKIKVTVPAQTIQKSKEKVLDVTSRLNTEDSVSTHLETSQTAKKAQSEKAKKKEEKWYG